MKRFIAYLAILLMLSISSLALGQEHSPHKHDSHANHIYSPIGVMGEHSHSKGDWMFTYSYNTMNMKGNLSGTNDVGQDDVLSDFMVSPTAMTMQMHMFGLMYGVSDKFMLMGMLPYSRVSMDHINRMGKRFTTEAVGVGDMKLTGTYTLYEEGSQKILLNAGISFPTGSTDERDDTPVGANQKLPYPMQLGSGTYDPLFGVSYTNQKGLWSWGSQLKATIRFGENDSNYRLGNEYDLTMWGVRKINDFINSSIRVDGKRWGNIEGSDPELNPMMVPTSRTDLRAGKRVDLLFGIDFVGSKEKLKDNRIAIEFGFPIYQNLNGPQLKVDSRLTVAWQIIF